MKFVKDKVYRKLMWRWRQYTKGT